MAFYNEGDHYVEWCEEQGLDQEDDHWMAFETAMESARADYLEDLAEARAEY